MGRSPKEQGLVHDLSRLPSEGLAQRSDHKGCLTYSEASVAIGTAMSVPSTMGSPRSRSFRYARQRAPPRSSRKELSMDT